MTLWNEQEFLQQVHNKQKIELRSYLLSILQNGVI